MQQHDPWTKCEIGTFSILFVQKYAKNNLIAWGLWPAKWNLGTRGWNKPNQMKSENSSNVEAFASIKRIEMDSICMHHV